MGYSISVVNNKYIEINSFGEVTNDELNNQIDELVGLNNEHNLKRILIDTEKVESMPDTFDLFHFMSKLPIDLIYAMYSPINSKNNEELKFAENVSVNRHVRIMLFNEKKSAIDWLLDD